MLSRSKTASLGGECVDLSRFGTGVCTHPPPPKPPLHGFLWAAGEPWADSGRTAHWAPARGQGGRPGAPETPMQTQKLTPGEGAVHTAEPQAVSLAPQGWLPSVRTVLREQPRHLRGLPFRQQLP